MLKKLLLGAAALAFCLPAGTALAHDDDDYDSYYSQHAQDHEEHGDFHEDMSIAHARAHAEGFDSAEEHADWHENTAQAHGEFHEDHPGTWHDHYDSGGYYGGGYAPYRNYSPSRRHYRTYRPSFSIYFGY